MTRPGSPAHHTEVRELMHSNFADRWSAPDRRIAGFALALLFMATLAALAVFGQGQVAKAVGTEVKVTTNSQFGDILTDASGRTLYLFKVDRRLQSNCSGACLDNWPPLLTDEPPVAGEGVNGDRLSTITVSGGSMQVTYNGWPLYYWRNDAVEGDTDGQGRGNNWYLVSPFGGPVHTSAQVTTNNNASLGDIITDESGRVLYLWKRDERNDANCNGNCALVWPPLLTTDAPAVSGALNSDRVGTVTRDDGSTQVTYNGWPLYYFDSDDGPGDANGQDRGNVWYAVSSHGAAVHTTATLSISEPGEFGAILTDPSGRTLYLFDRDDPGVSNCNGNCALNWPPLLTVQEPAAGGGAQAGLLGTVTRSDGYTQVTYNGSPLYYWANDVAPGDTTGQAVGGVWWVVNASGSSVEAPVGSPGGQAVTVTNGGSLQSQDGRVGVTLSPGDLPVDGTARLDAVDTPSSTIGLTGVRIASDAVAMSVMDGSGNALTGRLAGPAQVCVSYTDEDASGSMQGALGLRVLQFNGYWVTLTTQVDLLNGQACAQTSGQGPVVLGQSTR